MILMKPYKINKFWAVERFCENYGFELKKLSFLVKYKIHKFKIMIIDACN